MLDSEEVAFTSGITIIVQSIEIVILTEQMTALALFDIKVSSD